MNILLVYPQTLNHPNHPMGLLYIASTLEKAGHVVEVIDPRTDFDKNKFISHLNNFNPDFVGFTCTTIQVDLAYELAKIVRNNCAAEIVFGGVHPTVMSKDMIKNNFINYIIIGEGERTFLELCEGKEVQDIKGLIYKERQEVKINQSRELVQDLDSFPFPARHLLSDKWYFDPPQLRGIWTKATATIMASRGCPYKCIYCSSHLVFGYKVRYRSTNNVLAELENLRNDFNVDSVWFADDTFTVDKEWVKELCQKIIDKNWKDFVWCCQLRVDTIDEETLKLMKQAGCVQVDIGVESGSQKVLNILKKGITIEQIKDAFALCKKLKVQAFASMIIGTPGETKEDIKLTEQLIDEIKPDFTEFFFATPYPGTELYNIAVEKKLIDLDKPYEEWIASKQTDKPTIKSEYFTTEELTQIRSRLHNKVILKNYLTMFKKPTFVLGATLLTLKGIKGLPNGIKRFIKTGKIDNIFLGMLDSARRKHK